VSIEASDCEVFASDLDQIPVIDASMLAAWTGWPSAGWQLLLGACLPDYQNHSATTDVVPLGNTLTRVLGPGAGNSRSMQARWWLIF
jgi:hypothetical protein